MKELKYNDFIFVFLTLIRHLDQLCQNRLANQYSCIENSPINQNCSAIITRPSSNVELFMRLAKLMKSWTYGSVKFVWISYDRPTRSIRLLQTSEDRLRDKRRSSHATN